MKIYTKKGDRGMTQLVDCTPVSKNSLRLDCYGGLDELNSFLGLALSVMQNPKSDPALVQMLERIQNSIFVFGSQLACIDPATLKILPQMNEAWVGELEKHIDEMTAQLPPLKDFILPAGTSAASVLHVARTVCRKTERLCVALNEAEPINPLVITYLNRLSDYLFTAARFENWSHKAVEKIWEKP